jgi:hypothetical protein
MFQEAGQIPRQSAKVALIGLLSACACLIGCVERRYTIRTNPPGALAFVNGEEIGATPVSRSFTYYGPREVVLVADGFRTERIVQPIKAPWWDNYLTEFFSENLVPWTIRDDREFVYQLSPATLPSTAELGSRAENLRTRGQIAPAPRRKGLFSWLGF